MTFISSKNNTLLFIGMTFISVIFNFRKHPETYQSFGAKFFLSATWLRKHIQRSTSRHSENRSYRPLREDVSPLRSGNGGSVSAYRQFTSASRGIGGEEGRISTLRFSGFAGPRRVVAGGEASGLVGSDCEKSPARDLSLDNG
jgi:hypothetical protein